MLKQTLLYTGKAKSVYETDSADHLILVFRDDASAFNGEKIEQLDRKGKVNNRFNAFIMEKLAAAGIETHFEKLLSPTEVLVKKLQMIPVEYDIRNYSTGSLCRRLGVEEGKQLTPPTFELFFKDDALGDPMVNESQAIALGWANAAQLEKMKELTYQVNDVLKALFDAGNMSLVDYKLEFGVFHDRSVLGDEFSPDGCRLWDKDTKKKLDKDRFRQGLGGVVEAYEEVAARLGINLDDI